MANREWRIEVTPGALPLFFTTRYSLLATRYSLLATRLATRYSLLALATPFAATRSTVAIPAIMSHPELCPICATAATAASASPVSSAATARWRGSPTCPAAAARRKQALSAEVAPGAASATARRQCRMRVACADCVERRERAHQKIVARRRQPGSEPDQALNGRDRPSAGIAQTGQPAREHRHPRAGGARQRRSAAARSGIAGT